MTRLTVDHIRHRLALEERTALIEARQRDCPSPLGGIVAARQLLTELLAAGRADVVEVGGRVRRLSMLGVDSGEVTGGDHALLHRWMHAARHRIRALPATPLDSAAERAVAV